MGWENETGDAAGQKKVCLAFNNSLAGRSFRIHGTRMRVLIYAIMASNQESPSQMQVCREGQF
jgi:hypothetical protein